MKGKACFLTVFLALIMLEGVVQSASGNFHYSRPTITVVSPTTDVVYDYGSKIPLNVQVEMHPSGIPGLGPEELAEVRYSVDGQPELNASVKSEAMDYSKGYGCGYANATISGLAKGAHKLFIRGHTNLGNFSSEAVSFNRTVYFVVDSVSPAIEVISPLPTTYNSITVPVNFRSQNSLTWVGYSLDQKMVVDCLEGANMTYLQNGAHSLRVYGTDGGGNVYASKSVVFYVDGKKPPVVTWDVEKMVYDRQFLPSDYENMTYWHLVFHVNEPTSWTGYSINGGANQTLEANGYLRLTYGTYTIVVYAADLCGNKGASAPYTFTVGPGEAGSAYHSPSPHKNSTSTLPTEASDSASQEPIPWFPVAAVSVVVVVVVAVAAVVYLKKRRR